MAFRFVERVQYVPVELPIKVEMGHMSVLVVVVSVDGLPRVRMIHELHLFLVIYGCRLLNLDDCTLILLLLLLRLLLKLVLMLLLLLDDELRVRIDQVLYRLSVLEILLGQPLRGHSLDQVMLQAQLLRLLLESLRDHLGCVLS